MYHSHFKLGMVFRLRVQHCLAKSGPPVTSCFPAWFIFGLHFEITGVYGTQWVKSHRFPVLTDAHFLHLACNNRETGLPKLMLLCPLGCTFVIMGYKFNNRELLEVTDINPFPNKPWFLCV